MSNDLAVIGLGANLGSREATLRTAVAMLEAVPGCTVVARSALYLTEPIGPAQPAYLNAAVAVRTSLAPEALLDRLLAIETTLGRERRERWGPRTLDLDVLWLASGPVSTPRLRVPHPELLHRAFALAPLLDVAPHLAPIYGPHLSAHGTPTRVGDLGRPPVAPGPEAPLDAGALEVAAVGLDPLDAAALAVTDLARLRQGGRPVASLSRPVPVDPSDPLRSLVQGALAAQAGGLHVAGVALQGPTRATLVGRRSGALSSPASLAHCSMGPAEQGFVARLRLASARP